ncbi:MAG: GAF domain-containing sensor histidine kinase [Chloroflexi bacterium]|nr:GAF domain-containing sensor histidine kinase [Chloroflexota bacterium]
MAEDSRSLESLEALSAAISSGKPLAETADYVLDALRTEGAVDASELFLLDPRSHEMVLAGHSGLFPKAFRQITRFAVGQGFPGLVAASSKPLRTERLTDDKRYLRRLVKDKGFRYYLCLPLTGEEGVLGCLNLASRGQPISSEASQFAAIVSNGLALAADRARLRLWKDLSISLAGLQEGTFVERLCGLVLDHTVRISRALGGAIFLDGGRDVGAAVLATGVCQGSASAGAGITPTSAGMTCGWCAWRASILSLDTVQGKAARVCLAYPPGEPPFGARPWLRIATEESAKAINWALSLQHSYDGAASTERKRLSQEVHDGLSQNLSLIAQQAELASRLSIKDREGMRKELGALRATVRQSREEMYRVLRRMPPQEITDGLAAALRSLVRRLQKSYPLRIHLAISGEEDPPSQWRFTLFRIVQEALTNVIRHASASDVWIELDMRPPVLSLQVLDNGRGFVPAIPRNQKGGGLGLRHLRERAEALNGVLSVESAPGRGACLRLAAPYP